MGRADIGKQCHFYPEVPKRGFIRRKCVSVDTDQYNAVFKLNFSTNLTLNALLRRFALFLENF